MSFHEAEEGEDSSDEEDDTDPYWFCGVAPEEPPVGFSYAACPPLETEQQCHELIGRKVLVAHNRTKTLEPNWYMGRIKTYGVSAAWKKFSGNPNANFMIKYTKQSTDNALDADEAGELTAAKYGPGEWWLLLDPVMAQ